MRDITFHEGWPDGDVLFDYEPTLFHLPEHLALQKTSGWKSYFALDEKRRRVVASLYVNIDENRGTTAVRSPFGTIECGPNLSVETLEGFVRFCDSCLSRVVFEVEIKMSPQAYAPRTHALTFSFLQALGFCTTQLDLSACIPVTGSFSTVMHRSETQILNKSIEAGLRASLMPGDKLVEAYGLIHRHHGEKNYPVSMTWSQLENTASLFPGRYLTFGVHDGKKLVAAAIAVRVSSSVLSLFYIDHDSQYDKLSPPVLLIASIYDYCHINHIPLFDLGTSSLPHGPNLSLLAFKLRMGGTPSIKPTLRKIYHHA